MKTRILLSADQLGEEHVKRIIAACEGWADCRHISQNLPQKELKLLLSETEIMIGWTTPSFLQPSSLKAYFCGSAGYDAYVGIGLDKKENFRLTNASGIMSKPIAEHCLALMLALTRNLPVILAQQNMHIYERQWTVRELNDTTVCIVGLGGSGTELAGRCRAMGMKTVGVCLTPSKHVGVTDELFTINDINRALTDADHVVAVLPGGPSTYHLFNEQVFSTMKRGAYFYSASRGSVTDEQALISALRTGHIGGAGLDVFATEPLPQNSPLWDFPNVIVSPHTAGLSVRLNDRLTALFIENLHRYRDGSPLINQINPGQLV